MAFLALASGMAYAEPFVPDSDTVVVETLRDRPLDQTDRELRRLRAALHRAPEQVTLAIAVAQRCIAVARRDGDPRYIGYAQAALAPWWQKADMPAEVRLLRAVLLQSVHQFDAAMGELDVLLRQDPDNAQAWLTRASILQVQGHYDDAEAACQRLDGAARIYAQACLADLQGLHADAAAAAAQLAALRAGNPSLHAWLSLMAAELAQRRGRPQEAQRLFAEAVTADSDAYSRAAYADFLLDQGRPGDVIDLLAGSERSDPLLLRLALAYQARSDPRLAGAVRDLQARFDAARLRGDRVHLREEARFELELRHRSEQALPLARANWAVQKEPADMRVLLASAMAAGSGTDARVVRDFVASNSINDVRLAGFGP